jgi:hypothetical protein
MFHSAPVLSKGSKIGLISRRTETVALSVTKVMNLRVPQKADNFFEQLSGYLVPKQDSVPLSWLRIIII